jgi:predicted ATPase
MTSQADVGRAEAFLIRAMECAETQSALGWKLKAAISLARMWIEFDRGHEAREMLQSVYRRFVEGFQTRDLVIARELLDETGSVEALLRRRVRRETT